MIRRTPIRRVSKKRAKANAEYSVRRKRYLTEHPYCEFWLRERGIRNLDELKQRGEYVLLQVPRSTEIHHMRKPKCRYLNDESTWMAVSREGHAFIEANKNLARQRGYLYDI